MAIELFIQHGSKVYMPLIKDEISWDTERKGSPGKLSFTILRDGIIQIEEGDAVSFSINATKVFYGFIFTLKCDREQHVQVTAYDQLRYFKNKDTYVYANKTASQVLKTLAADFNLRTGTIENTSYVIPSQVEDNTELFDIMGNALDQTLLNKGEMYVLYDDYGKLCLKALERMKVGILIDGDTGENYDYTSSIDEETYNRIKLTYENSDTGVRDVYITQSGENINKWGILQYYDTLQEDENGKTKADALLKLYNAKTKKLKVTGALGDIRVRGGSMVIVNLDLGDVKLQNFMLVERAVHSIKDDEHTMDLTLRGGEFIA